MKTYIKNALLLTPDQLLQDFTLILDDGFIQDIVPNETFPIEDGMVIDADGSFVAPGLVDIHFHGALGKDTMDADPQAIEDLSQFCLEHGVTAFYPTTWSAAEEDIFDTIEAVRLAQSTTAGAQIMGVHVEGPYIDLKYRGAQLPSMIRTPNPVEFNRWFESGIVKLVTCAPEIEHGFEFIQSAVENGIKVSIGHSQATYANVVHAAELGATQATHIFNGMAGLHHREPGTVGGILSEKRIYAQMICDGVHLHPAVINLVIDAKTPNRTILITDAIRGTGLPDGDYDYKGQKFSVVENVARTPEGGLSGSTLTLDEALRNTLSFTGRPITDILPMATRVPAEAMGLHGKKGVLQPGADADLVFFDSDLHVQAVWVQGKLRFTK